LPTRYRAMLVLDIDTFPGAAFGALEPRRGRIPAQPPTLPRHRRGQGDVVTVPALGPVDATTAALAVAGNRDPARQAPVRERGTVRSRLSRLLRIDRHRRAHRRRGA